MEVPAYVLPELRTKVLQLLEQTPSSVTTADMNERGVSLFGQGQIELGCVYLAASCVLADRDIDGERPVVLTHRDNLAAAYQAAGRLSEAITLQRFNLKERLRLLPSDHPDTLQSRNNLAVSLYEARYLPEAIELLEFNLNEHQSDLNADRKRYLMSRNNLAAVYFAAGYSAEAISLLEANFRESVRVLKVNHPDTLNTHNNLGVAYQAEGLLREAIKRHRFNLKRCLRVLKADHPYTLNSRENLAVACREAGRLQEAVDLHEVSYSERVRVLTIDHPDTLTSRNNLGLAYSAARRFSDAIETHWLNLRESVRVFKRDHPATLVCLNNLAAAYRDVGRLIDTEVTVVESLLGIERLRGDQGILGRGMLAQSLRLDVLTYVLAAVRVRLGLAVETIVDAVEQGTARSVLDILQRRPADAEALARSLATAGKWTDGQLQTYLADTQRLGNLKGVEAAPGANPLIVGAARAEVRAILTRLAAADRELLPSAKPRTLDEIRASIDDGEVMLLYGWSRLTATVTVITPHRSSECGGVLLCNDPDVDAEEARVGQAQAVAELIAAGISPDIERLKEVEQAIAVVRKDELLWLRLGNGLLEEVSQFVAGLKHAWAKRQRDRNASVAVRSMKVAALDALAEEFLSFVLPVEARAAVARASRVILIPSGPLHELPLDSLAEMAGVSELAGKPIVTAPSASIYAMLKARKAGVGNYLPAIVGDPDTGLEGPGSGGFRGAGRTAESLGREVSSPRSLRQIERQLLMGERAEGFGRLPRAKQEALDVARLFGGKLNRPVRPLLDAEATVPAFYSEAAGKRLLHLAAHAVLGRPKDPMGSAVLLAKQGDDSGLLRLDMLLTQWPDRLLGCDLVVLSCCQSGRGVKLGDSLMALPIGLFHAGVRCVVASLWKVDDLATWLLMRRFYENLLGCRAGREQTATTLAVTDEVAMSGLAALAEAKRYLQSMSLKVLASEITAAGGVVNEAERQMLDSKDRTVPPFAHPRYWAAFVFIGAVD